MAYLKNDSDCAMEQSEYKKIGIQVMRLPEFSVDGSEVGRSHGR